MIMKCEVGTHKKCIKTVFETLTTSEKRYWLLFNEMYVNQVYVFMDII